MKIQLKSILFIAIFTIGYTYSYSQYGAPDPNSVGSGINIVVGTFSGNNQMTGNNNSLFGSNTGSQMMSGSDNSIFGSESGTSIVNGFGNTFIGVGTGRLNNGNQNTFVGRSAGESNISGTDNCFLGESAGNLVTGSSNICIGSFAGPFTNAAVSDRLYINAGRSDDPLIYGEFDSDFVRINGTFEVTAGLSNPSDVNLKTNFKEIDEDTILRSVSKLNIQQWNYKKHPNHKHIGPTAQEFYSLFKVGSDNKHISTIDASGVALASIKALINENETLKSKVKSQDELLKKLILRVEALEIKE